MPKKGYRQPLSVRIAHSKRMMGNKYSFKGGSIIEGYKYIYVPNHPFCMSNGCVAEHRLVMENKLGRYLIGSEEVDHINGDKLDNRIENLQLFSNHGDHIKIEYSRGKYEDHLSHRDRNGRLIGINSSP